MFPKQCKKLIWISPARVLFSIQTVEKSYLWDFLYGIDFFFRSVLKYFRRTRGNRYKRIAICRCSVDLTFSFDVKCPHVELVFFCCCKNTENHSIEFEPVINKTVSEDKNQSCAKNVINRLANEYIYKKNSALITMYWTVICCEESKTSSLRASTNCYFIVKAEQKL
jgi:hypothetical protein